MKIISKFLLYILALSATMCIVKILPDLYIQADKSPYLACCLLIFTAAYWLGHANKRI